MSKRIVALFFLLAPLASASVLPREHDSAGHTEKRALPARWYHDDDHPVHSLFKRDGSEPTDGSNYATVGSPAWSSAYPQSTPDPSQYPQAWVDALNAAVSAGKIPNIPVSTMAPNQNPTYPQGMDPTGTTICSATYQCRNPDDIWDAPAGVVAIGFDDGPLPPSDNLYKYLQQQNQTATHFFIGVNILSYPNEFNMAFATLEDDIAVHTWTHPYMTTLNNSAVLGQLGWTMEIIHNSTGGRIPRFWRPPYGDADNRVRAIAKEVFGLETIVWNHDTNDWSLPSGGTTAQAVHNSMQQWLTGPKSPGLIILEHELSDQSVSAFIDAYPMMKSNGWKTVSTAQTANISVWQNSDSDTAAVTSAPVPPGSLTPASSASSSSSSSGSASNSPSTTGSNGAALASPSAHKSAGVAIWGGINVGYAMSALAIAMALVGFTA